MSKMKEIYEFISSYSVNDIIYISDMCSELSLDYKSCLYILNDLEKHKYLHLVYLYKCTVCSKNNTFDVFSSIQKCLYCKSVINIEDVIIGYKVLNSIDYLIDRKE